VVPDHDNNIDNDPHEGLQWEESIAFDKNKDIVKEVTTDEDYPQYNVPKVS
jgi:hypothetical protein